MCSSLSANNDDISILPLDPLIGNDDDNKTSTENATLKSQKSVKKPQESLYQVSYSMVLT